MKKGEIFKKEPERMEIEPGTYYWCKCGKSKNQPFCDNSHTETEFTPVEFIIEEKRKVALCLCKQTNTPPYCDGTHRSL